MSETITGPRLRCQEPGDRNGWPGTGGNQTGPHPWLQRPLGSSGPGLGGAVPAVGLSGLLLAAGQGLKGRTEESWGTRAAPHPMQPPPRGFRDPAGLPAISAFPALDISPPLGKE